MITTTVIVTIIIIIMTKQDTDADNDSGNGCGNANEDVDAHPRSRSEACLLSASRTDGEKLHTHLNTLWTTTHIVNLHFRGHVVPGQAAWRFWRTDRTETVPLQFGRTD